MPWFVVIAIFILTACAPEPRPSTSSGLTVSAAANLQPALGEIGAQFEQQTGTHVAFNFGSTGQLAQQIVQGASVDLFVAADRSTVDDLAARGLVIPDTLQLYARGQIVLYTRGDSPLQLQALADLARPEVKRVAIAHPDRAPYGFAAREALQNAGVWSAVESKIILAENIQQTQQYADTGNVDAAIVALSLATGSKGRRVAIPQELYKPIDQALGIVKDTRHEREARAFAALIVGPVGRAVFVKYGYSLPNAN